MQELFLQNIYEHMKAPLCARGAIIIHKDDKNSNAKDGEDMN
jgi:hypothetical protein